MPNRLNTDRLKLALEAAGISPSALATKLDVSREAVSKWLNGESYPRPDKLLRLANIAGLGFRELVLQEDEHAPRVAFRKVRGTTTTDRHVMHAQEIGRALRAIVPYLPFDKLVTPSVLKDPVNEYGYLQEVSIALRKSFGLKATDQITFPHLVKSFRDLQAVLVPVLWGKKGQHENATHIYLPDSRTTWIYLNLDVQAHDFLFWMAHELGHSLSPDLTGEDAEDFADAFAAALLFPKEMADRAYGQIFGKPPGRQVNLLKQWARELTISPYCVYKEINAFAKHAGRPELALASASIHGGTTNFNKGFHLISETFFNGKPAASDLISVTKTHFQSPFFEALETYLRETGKGSGYIESILDMSNTDAKGIHEELT